MVGADLQTNARTACKFFVNHEASHKLREAFGESEEGTFAIACQAKRLGKMTSVESGRQEGVTNFESIG